MARKSWRSSPRLIGLTAFISTFVDGALHGLVVPILPYSLVDRSKVSQEDVQFWLACMLAVFGIVNAICSPFVGWACSRCRSTRTSYLVAQALALAGTLLMCFGRTIQVLILARALQGASASIIYISTIGMIIELLDKSCRGAWIGFAFSGLSMSLVVSPFLGGFLYETKGYYAVFQIIFVLIGVAIVLRLLIDEGGYDRGLPEPIMLKDSAVERGMPLGQSQDQQDSRRVQSACSVMALIFSSHRIRVALFGGFVHTTIITSFDTILPIMVQRTFHWSSSLAGTAFLALAFPSLLSSVAGAYSDRVGPRKTALLGFTLTICGLMPMTLIGDNPNIDEISLYVLLAIVGLGLTFVLSPLAADVSVESDDLAARYPDYFPQGAFAQTFAAFNIGLGLAATLGPALSGLLYGSTSWGFTMFVLAALCALSRVAVSRFTGDLSSGNLQETELKANDE